MPPLNRHQFGGALGGAVVIPGLYDGHDRTFFFADYAGIKERRGVTTVNTVPSAAARIGDFSNYRDRNGNLIPIFDPLTTRLNPNFNSSLPVSATNPQFLRDQFPNNIIPADRLHPVGRNIASIYPLPNNGSGNFDNYISTPDREITDHAYSGRVDHRFTDNDSVFVRFNYGKFSLDAPQGQANCCLPTPADAAARFDLGPFVAGIQNTRLTTHGAAFNYSKVLTPTFVNELRVGYAKTNPFTTQSDYGLNSATSLGIQGINVNEITTGLPNIDITNFTGISGGPAFLPVNPSQFHYQIENALVWIKGRHQMKFGYRLVDRAPSPMIHDNTRSLITFGTSFVNNPVTNTGGTGLAEVLLRLLQQRVPRIPSRSPALQRRRARGVRAGRLQGQQPVDRECRASLRDLQRADGRAGPDGQLRLPDLHARLRRRERRDAAVPTRRRATTTSRRAWA